MDLRVITTVYELAELEQRWLALENNCTVPATVFQSFGWVKTWAEIYANAVKALHILTGFSGGRLVFIMPLQKCTARSGIATLRWLSEPIGQYGDVLCAAGENVDDWMGAAIMHLKKNSGVDVLLLRHIRQTSNIAAYAKKNFKSGKLDEKAPSLDLTLFTSEADYDARYTKVQRTRRKKIRKALEEKGAVTFAALPAGCDNDRALAHAIAEKNLWLKERGRINRVLGAPEHLEFFKRLSFLQKPHLQLVTTELKTGIEPISWDVGFRYHNTHFAYLTSHVAAATVLSPGRLHMDLSQRDSLKAGMKCFDLMVPYDQHKESWSSSSEPVDDYFFAITWRGAAYGRIYLAQLRPALRKIYYRLPPKALRAIAAMGWH